MEKSFIISSYLGSPEPERLAEYADSARAVIEGNGGRFAIRGKPTHTYQDGRNEGTIVSSAEQAVAAYKSPAYQAARKLLGPVSRHARVIEQAD